MIPLFRRPLNFITRLDQFDDKYSFYAIVIDWAMRTEIPLARILGGFNKVSSHPDCLW